MKTFIIIGICSFVTGCITSYLFLFNSHRSIMRDNAKLRDLNKSYTKIYASQEQKYNSMFKKYTRLKAISDDKDAQIAMLNHKLNEAEKIYKL